MADAYVVEAARTAGGRKNGALVAWHPADIAAEPWMRWSPGTGIDPHVIDDVIVGCVSQAVAEAFALARNAVLAP